VLDDYLAWLFAHLRVLLAAGTPDAIAEAKMIVRALWRERNYERQ
jgi:hypothetical protein